MIRHISGIAEIVEDIDQAISFYGNMLGMSVEHEEGSGYAIVEMGGILHFGIWERKVAAESVYGEGAPADSIPLGFLVGFEVDEVAQAIDVLQTQGRAIEQSTRREPWGQITSRYFSLSGALCEFSETPWARSITQPMKTSGSE